MLCCSTSKKERRTSDKERKHWYCDLLALIICCDLLYMIYNFPSASNTTKKNPSFRSAFGNAGHPYLQEECFTYSNLTARFTCNKGYTFKKFTSDLILRCASNLWKQIRNPKEVDSWKMGALNSTRTINYTELSGRPVVHWVLVGDSHIRYIFEVLVGRLQDSRIKYRIASFQENKWEDARVMLDQKRKTIHEDYHEVIHLDIPLKITYRWEAMLENLPSLLKSWKSNQLPRPTVLLLGTALHFMKSSYEVYLSQGKEKAAEKFSSHLELLSSLLTNFAEGTPIIFKLQDHLQGGPANVFSNNENIDYYNGISRSMLVGTPVAIWDSTLPLADLYNEECRIRYKNTPETDFWKCEDTRHIGYIMIEQYLDMLLNQICHSVLH